MRPLAGDRGIILNEAALAPWKLARANRASSPADIVAIGTSITEGYNSCTYGSRWVDIVAQKLKTNFPTSGAAGQNGSSFIPAYYFGTWLGTQSYSATTGTVTDSATGGGGLRVSTLSNTTPGSRTYPFSGTSFDLIYTKQTTVTSVVNISIDGGTTAGVDLFTLDANQSGGYGTVGKWTSPALSAGAHTVKITWSSGTQPFYIHGIVAYNGDETKGIRVHEFGHAGQRVSGAIAPPTNSGGTVTADLILMDGYTSNDFIFQTDLASFQSGMRTLITNWRTFFNNSECPVLLLSYTEPGSTPGGQLPPFYQYLDVWRELTRSMKNVAFLDLSRVSWPVAAKSPAVTIDPYGYYDTDRLHPSAAGGGHAFLGQVISDILSR